MLLLIINSNLKILPGGGPERVSRPSSLARPLSYTAKIDPKALIAQQSNHISTKNSSLMEEYIPTHDENLNDFYTAEPTVIAQQNPSTPPASTMFSWFRPKPTTEQKVLTNLSRTNSPTSMIKEIDFADNKAGKVDVSSIELNPIAMPIENGILQSHDQKPLEETSFEKNAEPRDNKLNNSAPLDFIEPQQLATKKPEQEISQRTYYSFSTATHNNNGSLTSLEYINHKSSDSPLLTIDYDVSSNSPAVKSATIMQNGKKDTLPFTFNPETNKYTATFVSNKQNSMVIEFDPRSTTGQIKITENINAELPIETWFNSQGNVNRQKASNQSGKSVRQYTKMGSTVSVYDPQGTLISIKKYDLNGDIIPDNTNQNRPSNRSSIDQKASLEKTDSSEISSNNKEILPTNQTNMPKSGRINSVERKSTLENPSEYNEAKLIKNITEAVAKDIQNQFSLENPSKEQVVDITTKKIKSIPEYEALTQDQKIDLEGFWKTYSEKDLSETDAYPLDISQQSFSARTKNWIAQIIQIFLDFIQNAEKFRQAHLISSRQKQENESLSVQQQRQNKFTNKIRSGLEAKNKLKSPEEPQVSHFRQQNKVNWDFSNLSSRPAQS